MHYESMDIITWLVVGLVAGVLASLIMGGFGIIADIVVGIVGAFIGGWLFRYAGWHAPFAGLACRARLRPRRYGPARCGRTHRRSGVA